MKKRLISFLLGLLLVFAVPISSVAYDLPPVNLGFTSFMDGAPPSGPGLYYTQYIQYWTSDDFLNAQGENAFPATAGEDLDALISLSQFIYQSDTEVALGAKWGLDVILPYVSLDLTFSNPGPYPQDNGSGFGDLLIGPYLQWDLIMGENGPRFLHRLEFQCIFPTGKYQWDRELNPGSNFFSFNPYWAATYFFTPRFTLSTRAHYLWNDENDDPNRGFSYPGDPGDPPIRASHTKAGSAIHINFASSYELLPKKLRVGINGYYLKQITDTEMDGNNILERREKVLAIGPGLLYSINADAHFFFNMFFEDSVENRPSGTRLNVRFVYHF